MQDKINFAGYFQPNETFSNLCKSDTKPVTIFLFFTLKFCVIRITWRSTLTTTMVTEVKTGTLKEVVELQLKHTMGSIKFLSSCISYLPNFWLPNASQYNLFFITNHSGIKSTIMRKSAKAFNISGWLFLSLMAKSKVPIHTSYLPH